MTRGRARGILAADGLTLACAAAAIWLCAVGPYRDAVGDAVVTIRWTHLAFAAAALAAVRHAAVSAPSLLDTLRAARVQLTARPAMVDALVAFTLTRPTVLLVGLLAVATIGFPPGVDEPGMGRRAVSGLPVRFDANWYAGLAADGYDWQGRFDRQQNLAFFPAYPLAVRALGFATGGFDENLPREVRLQHLAWCGLAISLAAFLWAGWYFSVLARELLPPADARGALVLLAAYPFAVFFSAAYTESLFLLASLGAWHAMRRGRTTSGLVWGALAGLSRPNGFVLSVPLGLLALGVRDMPPHGARRPVVRQLLAAAAPVAGMLAFTLYLQQRTGVWFAWARMHGAWGREFTGEAPPVLGIVAGGDGLIHAIAVHPYDTLNALGVLFALLMLTPVWRKLGPAWCAYVVASVVPPLLAGGVLSMGRLTSTLFPLFLALGAIIPSRRVPALAAFFGILQGLGAALFYTWRSLY